MPRTLTVLSYGSTVGTPAVCFPCCAIYSGFWYRDLFRGLQRISASVIGMDLSVVCLSLGFHLGSNDSKFCMQLYVFPTCHRTAMLLLGGARGGKGECEKHLGPVSLRSLIFWLDMELKLGLAWDSLDW